MCSLGNISTRSPISFFILFVVINSSTIVQVLQRMIKLMLSVTTAFFVPKQLVVKSVTKIIMLPIQVAFLNFCWPSSRSSCTYSIGSQILSLPRASAYQQQWTQKVQKTTKQILLVIQNNILTYHKLESSPKAGSSSPISMK